MATAPTNGIELEYETFGDDGDPPLLLIMGLGVQLLHWDERLCRKLAARGFFVIRFDNRDAGLSAKIEGGPQPDPLAALQGDTSSAAYLLSDMAADTAGLLDHLGLDAAHVMGASMGGMIAQTVAIEHPDRVLSLTSIMSTTGDRSVGGATQAATEVLLTPAPDDREGYAERSVVGYRTIGSPGFPFDEEGIRDRGRAAYDRSYYPVGIARQLVAILASGDRTERLRELDVPTLVIHGDSDPLVDVSGGRATAAAIPGSELRIIEGMGHDLPQGAWDEIVDAVVALAERAGAPAG